ncbi:hypothetical protein PGT21_005446 [Puccinia graminis f. sp. tritici]|uniref:Secreted protein n=1 Tax=Puccinia graminis f. sp. tritici TaxID=56615 RepID=A0A5B0NXE0_PUCGR|nr:hypothetical protein PGT21_005446 [Puccinia graminis f. sp. tritici]
MLSIKTAIFLAIVACGFATGLTWEQRTRCTFGCEHLHVGGCGRVVGRDPYGSANQWRYVPAYKTEGYEDLYNCYDTGMEFNVCPEPGKIVVPPRQSDMFVTLPEVNAELGDVIASLPKTRTDLKGCLP